MFEWKKMIYEWFQTIPSLNWTFFAFLKSQYSKFRINDNLNPYLAWVLEHHCLVVRFVFQTILIFPSMTIFLDFHHGLQQMAISREVEDLVLDLPILTFGQAKMAWPALERPAWMVLEPRVVFAKHNITQYNKQVKSKLVLKNMSLKK